MIRGCSGGRSRKERGCGSCVIDRRIDTKHSQTTISSWLCQLLYRRTTCTYLSESNPEEQGRRSCVQRLPAKSDSLRVRFGLATYQSYRTVFLFPTYTAALWKNFEPQSQRKSANASTTPYGCVFQLWYLTSNQPWSHKPRLALSRVRQLSSCHIWTPSQPSFIHLINPPIPLSNLLNSLLFLRDTSSKQSPSYPTSE